VRQLSELLAGGRVSTDQRRKEFYDVLVRESVRLHRLVESLLNFARLEAGELEYQFVALSPGSFVRDVVKDFQGENLGRKVHIELAGDESPLPTIQADRELLSRVIWNLLDNAVKYSPDPCQVHVEIETTRKQLMVRVRDRGVGIPADERLEIFDKFVRGAAAKAASIKGTGIGLAMTRQIVRAHGGEIVVESEVGAGSTFTVTLPLTPAPERDAAITEPTNSHSGLATALDDRR
jgi:signal transduction histidine kinase